MADFRIPRKPTPVRKKNGGTTGRSLPPSFGGSIFGSGSSGEGGKKVDLFAEVFGRTNFGVTGRLNLNGGGSKDNSGTSGGGTINAGIGYEDKDYKFEAVGGIGGSFFLPADILKDLGIKNSSNISDLQLRKLTASIKDAFDIGAQDELSISVTPKNNFLDGVDGVMVRYKIRF